MAHVCWTYDTLMLTDHTACSFFSVYFPQHIFQHPYFISSVSQKITNKYRKFDDSIILFLISVCSSIQNIVGTGFLNTTSLIRGLTFYFIKYLFFFAFANLKMFLLKINPVRQRIGFNRNHLCQWLFFNVTNCLSGTASHSGQCTSSIPALQTASGTKFSVIRY